MTPLQRAIRNSEPEIAQVLISAGADVNAFTNKVFVRTVCLTE